MKVLLALLLAAALAGCSTTKNVIGDVGGWFGLSGGSAKTKPAELAEIKPVAKLTRLWDVNVGAGKPYAFSPASDGQAVYAASADGRVVKLDLATGKEVWRAEAKQSLSAGVGVGSGVVLVGTPKGQVLAFRTDNGQLDWTATLSGEILTAPVAAGGLVAARGNDGRIWLFDAADGKQRWVYSRVLPALISRLQGDLLLTSRALFAGHPGGKLTALSLANGAPLWEANVALPKGVTELERIADVAGALAADDHLVCAGAYQGRLGCFDQTTGNPVWMRDFSSPGGVAMGPRFLFAADEHSIIQGYDKLRGASLWKQESLLDREVLTPVVFSKYVAVADYQGIVHLLSLEEGALVGRAGTDGSAVIGHMQALGDDGLLVQTVNGGVYAFKIQ
ncbi:outer membrane protein assembly factor BamB [Parasulfuritortus cantonensis]|nr:outer membrane protein assembly factor BamB [Parasulfuritortus cantonensis]